MEVELSGVALYVESIKQAQYDRISVALLSYGESLSRSVLLRGPSQWTAFRPPAARSAQCQKPLPPLGKNKMKIPAREEQCGVGNGSIDIIMGSDIYQILIFLYQAGNKILLEASVHEGGFEGSPVQTFKQRSSSNSS
jgi:hypothetical protein